MKRNIFLFLVTLVLFVPAVATAQSPPPLTVNHWGESQIDEDGNLRFRINASASGISWTDDLTDYSPLYLQLWAMVWGETASGTLVEPFPVLIKSKDAYNKYDLPAQFISGTSPRFKLAPGKYYYQLVVALNETLLLGDALEAVDHQVVHGPVTLP
jgi:hypothetical protein